jgi:hypothetical protein
MQPLEQFSKFRFARCCLINGNSRAARNVLQARELSLFVPSLFSALRESNLFMVEELFWKIKDGSQAFKDHIAGVYQHSAAQKQFLNLDCWCVLFKNFSWSLTDNSRISQATIELLWSILNE